MARIVLVHGAFNEFWGPHGLKARWLPALRDGLWHHQREISDDDVAICFYGDLFRQEPGSEAELQLQKSRAGVAESLAELFGSDLLAALGQAASNAAFERIVDMMTIMSTTPDLRARMRARIDALVDANTRVVAAHSIGTVLSYMALCSHPHWNVHTFVTLGSPLAAPMFFERLDPPAIDGKGQWPGAVRRWVNVRAVGDKAAAISLREKFGPQVEERLIDNGHHAHDPERYLNAAATGDAIAAALA